MSPRIGLTIQDITEAAAQIADTKGIEEVTLAALAQHLGVKSPSLYNHVKGLPGVRKKLGIYAMERLYHLLEQAVEDKQKDDAIQALGFAYVSFVRNHPGLYEATFLRDEDVQKAGDSIVSLCLRVLQEYDLKGEQALHATRGLRSICHGFASLEQHDGFGLPIDVDTSFHLLLRSFIEGVRVMK
ncbi:TetR/AcrR family transcriptional regulator [Bacillus cytotoxicus]|uniref:TetR/AcrR family transcriptional regulator n=1 Tax=unclassified Bacillus cereus group TaxID=2750818 RepID=UPI001F590454|nr:MULTISPECIES: TetR/AcrR family transcriptional regulator [unclassified Bacillus cereus group]EMA6342351.1 TetR/AcrR family transcriptional regulator [Bacillus cytotoxicus]